MTFHDIRFPTRDEWGSSGGPGNSTGVISMDSGQTRRITRWSQFRHQYDVAWQVKEFDLLSEVKAFYLARGGIANSFRFKDWQDYNTTATGHDWENENSPHTKDDQEIGIGDGTTTTFQLIKRYEDDAGSYVRTLKRIVEDSVLVAIDGVNQASGWTVNINTGVVTFDVAPSIGEVVTAGCEFDVEVRFGDGVDEFFAAAADNFGSGSIPNLPLVEELDGSQHDEDRHYGGAKGPIEYSAAMSLDMSSLVWVLDPQAIELKVFLPDIDDVPLGGPIFVIHNVSASSVFLRDSGDTTQVATIALDAKYMIYAGLDAAGAREWYAFEFA